MNFRLRRPHLFYTIPVGLAWLLGGAVSLGWNLSNQRVTLFEQARSAAQASLQKDLDYRRWASQAGGVYVPVSEVTPPNPYLARLPERDITTPSGKRLTLMNPAYMNRQVHEIQRLLQGARGHLTSANPQRPENSPDIWEQEALKRLAAGAEEVSSVEKMDGIEYIRYIRPVRAEEPCIKCHASMGYKVGDLVGGLDVSLPMAPFRQAAAKSLRAVWLGHGAALILGLSLIGFGAGLYGRIQARQRDAEDRIRRSLEEKEVLLREIHHRVKNNLQVVSSMLDLQARMIPDEKGRSALKEGRDRIRTMALIHENLYRSEDLGHVNMDEYLRSLVEALYRSYGKDQSQVALSLDLAPVTVNLETAIPMGLVVTELVSNALKYAHPVSWRQEVGRPGLVRVNLAPKDKGFLVLRIADDGIGLPEGFSIDSTPSLGLKLARSIVRQMGGTLTFSGQDGTVFTARLPVKMDVKVVEA